MHENQSFRIPRKKVLLSTFCLSQSQIFKLLSFLRDIYDLKYQKKTFREKTKPILPIAIEEPLQLKDDKDLLEKRNKIINELITTEETYVRELGLLLDIYYLPIKALELLNSQNFYFLFANMDKIYSFHKK